MQSTNDFFQIDNIRKTQIKLVSDVYFVLEQALSINMLITNIRFELLAIYLFTDAKEISPRLTPEPLAFSNPQTAILFTSSEFYLSACRSLLTLSWRTAHVGHRTPAISRILTGVSSLPGKQLITLQDRIRLGQSFPKTVCFLRSKDALWSPG